jgi:hypothetical protein
MYFVVFYRKVETRGVEESEGRAIEIVWYVRKNTKEASSLRSSG